MSLLKRQFSGLVTSVLWVDAGDTRGIVYPNTRLENIGIIMIIFPQSFLIWVL